MAPAFATKPMAVCMNYGLDTTELATDLIDSHRLFFFFRVCCGSYLTPAVSPGSGEGDVPAGFFPALNNALAYES